MSAHEALLEGLRRSARNFTANELNAPEGAGTSTDVLESAARRFAFATGSPYEQLRAALGALVPAGTTWYGLIEVVKHLVSNAHAQNIEIGKLRRTTPGMMWSALFNALGDIADGERWPSFDELIAEVAQLRRSRDAIQRDANVALEQRREADARAGRLDARVTAAEADLEYARNQCESWRSNAADITRQLNDARERVASLEKVVANQREMLVLAEHKVVQHSDEQLSKAHAMLNELRNVLQVTMTWPSCLEYVRGLIKDNQAARDAWARKDAEIARLHGVIRSIKCDVDTARNAATKIGAVLLDAQRLAADNGGAQ